MIFDEYGNSLVPFRSRYQDKFTISAENKALYFIKVF
jgi:hypothetical protein